MPEGENSLPATEVSGGYNGGDSLKVPEAVAAEEEYKKALAELYADTMGALGNLEIEHSEYLAQQQNNNKNNLDNLENHMA